MLTGGNSRTESLMGQHTVGGTTRDPDSMVDVGRQTPPMTTAPSPMSTTTSCVTRPSNLVTMTARGQGAKPMMCGHPCGRPRRCLLTGGRCHRSGAVSHRPWRRPRLLRSKKNRVEVGGREGGRRPLAIRVIDVHVGPAIGLGAPHRAATRMEGGSVGGKGGRQPRRWAARWP
jgi:hypothetical protein